MAEGKKSRKHGRNAMWCQGYRNSETRAKNKAKKMLRHIARYGTTDHTAVHCYNNLHIYARDKGPKSLTPTKSKCKRIAPRSPMDRKKPTPRMSNLVSA